MTKISMKINLIRNKREGKAVHGTITLQMGRDAILCSTLEQETDNRFYSPKLYAQ